MRTSLPLCLCAFLSLGAGIPDSPIDTLLPLIEQQESGGDPNALGDYIDPDGPGPRPAYPRAVGILQIHTIMVDECNRILGHREFTYADRFDTYASHRMFSIYSLHWAAHYSDYSLRGIAARWNGGPSGHTNPVALAYADRTLSNLK